MIRIHEKKGKKNMKTGRKTLGVLLSFCMLLAIVPMTVFAAGTECVDGNDCTEHAAAIGSTHYDTLQEAINAAQNDAEVLLLKDVKEILTINKPNTSFVLNLNTHTVDSTEVDSYDVVKLYGDDLTLTIKNGTLKNTGAQAYGIYAYNAGSGKGYKNLNLLLDGVTIDTGDQPLGVQGLNSNQNVTVKNSVITTKTTGIYFPPVSGILAIDNSQITAVNNGIVVKGGKVVITGEDTVITATGTPEPQDDPYTGDVTGEGFPKTGNAVYVEGGYKGEASAARPIAVEINDGVFESQNATAVAANHLEDLNTQGAEVNGGIFSSDVEQFVAEDAASVSLTSNGESKFYIGASETVAERIAGAAAAGDEIAVKQGNVAFVGLPSDITVQNDGDGTVTANGEEVNETPVVTHTHTWKAPVWVWADDYTEATATFTCTDDAAHTEVITVTPVKKVTSATCTEDGSAVYTATAELDGETYTDTKTVVIPAAGHNYVDGKCTVCGEKDPNAVKDDNTDTGVVDYMMLFAVLAIVSAGAVVFTVKKAAKR